MNLTLHILRKDIRQFRILLAVWFALLLLHLGVDLGWVGQVTYSHKDGFDHAANVWTGLLPVVANLLFILLPTFVVLTDSPSRREGFLATRPVPKGDLTLAKLLFILCLMVVPFVSIELIHLGFAGVPGWVVARGTFERLVMVVPVAFGFGAYASLWPDVARWARSVGIVFGFYIVLALTIEVLQFAFKMDVGHLSKLPDFIALIFLAIFMVIFAAWHARAHRGALARWGGLTGIAVVMFTLLHVWPWKMFALKPADQPAAEAMVKQAGFEVAPLGFYLSKVQNPQHPAPQFSVDIRADSKPLPDGYSLDWNSRSGRLVRNDGTEVSGGEVYEHSVFNSYFQGPMVDYNAYASLAADFPSDVMFRETSYMNYGFVDPLIGFNNFDLPTTKAEQETPLTLHAEVDGQVYKWTRIADLALTPGAASTDEFGSWKFIAVNTDETTPNTTQIFLQRRQIVLNTASDSRCSAHEYGPLAHMTFMVYDPLTHVAWRPEPIGNDTSRSPDSALQQIYRMLTFNNRQPFSAAEIARCHLIIYQKTWVGTVTKEWESPSFTIKDRLMVYYPRAGGNGEAMPQAEFERRMAALKAPSPDAARAEISSYLLEYLRLVEARRFVMSSTDPHVRQLAVYVPAQLDLMIDGLPAMDYAARQTVLDAITAGATEAQKPAVIAALQREPELVTVLFARGWENDARAEILQLAQCPHFLPEAAVKAIAGLQDTNTYPRLLAEFDSNPSLSLLSVLRTLPGLEPALQDIVSRHWRKDSLVYRHQNIWEMFSYSFQLAASYGDTSTLQRAYLLLPEADRNDLGNNLEDYLPRAMRSAIWMSDLSPSDENNDRKVIAWLRQHRPEDFVFNPGLHQFVLKSISTGGDTAVNSQP